MLEKNLIRIFEESFRENYELPALSDYFKQETFTYDETACEIAKLHMLFEHSGIEPGDKVALIGRNNPRWCITYIATVTYGAVIVPILQDFNANDVHHILNHSDSRMIFCGDTFWDIIEIGQVPELKGAFSLTDFSCFYSRKGTGIAEYSKNLNRRFREKYPDGFCRQDIQYREVANDQVIVLNYTSGTTGFSKGVMLTCNNLTGNVCFCLDKQIRRRGEQVLSFLPLAHAYGCTVDMLLSLAVGSHLTLLGKMPAPKVLIEAMNVVGPRVVCCVPLILEKICRKQVFPILTKDPAKDAPLYPKIKEQLLSTFGGQVEEFIIGGAPLNREVEEFLVRINFPITVGYGMTECAPLISYTHWFDYKPTSCGMVLHGYMEVKIDSPDPYTIPGEIMTRGENTMVGYYKNQQATDEILDADGWLHTGDIGTVDPDGTIYIRGRCKSMVLGPNGQNIYPEEIEAKLNNLYCVMESLVVERDGKLVALVYPDYEQIDADGLSSARVLEIMKDNLVTLNTLVAPYEKVSDLVLYPNEFEKTPKKSIKRYLYNL